MVAAAHQRKDYGAAALRLALLEMKDAGATRLRTAHKTSNGVASMLYRRHGFVEIGICPTAIKSLSSSCRSQSSRPIATSRTRGRPGLNRRRLAGSTCQHATTSICGSIRASIHDLDYRGYIFNASTLAIQVPRLNTLSWLGCLFSSFIFSRLGVCLVRTRRKPRDIRGNQRPLGSTFGSAVWISTRPRNRWQESSESPSEPTICGKQIEPPRQSQSGWLSCAFSATTRHQFRRICRICDRTQKTAGAR
jgi:hypothetical protein